MGSRHDKYRRRVARNGDNIGKAYASNTIAFKEATFHASPTFRVLEVKSSEFPNVKQMDARVVEVERMGTLREVLFRPFQGLNIGTYVKFDGDTWLAFDKWGNSEDQKLMVQKCNRTIKWKDRVGVIHEIECIASATPLGSKANQSKMDIEYNQYDVRLPTGQLYAFFEANAETRRIKINQRFIFGSNVYEVFGVDDTTTVDNNGFGIIQLTLKLSTKQDKDDFENRIAYNIYSDCSTETPNEIPVGEEEDNGGRIW